MAITHAEVKKIVTSTVSENGLTRLRVHDDYIEFSCGITLFPVQVDLTPFQLRCLLHGFGFKCDWDEPVTFERLMAIEEARDCVESEGRVSIGIFDFWCPEDDYSTWHLIDPDFVSLQSMRQVYLLLEVAGVGE